MSPHDADHQRVKMIEQHARCIVVPLLDALQAYGNVHGLVPRTCFCDCFKHRTWA
jgi:hypothetical protein